MLTNTVGEFRAFGYEAEQRYTEYKDETEVAVSEHLVLFRNFKMQLMKAEVRFSQAIYIRVYKSMSKSIT